jgi:DNA-binding transcriptional ArsR family regulator
VEGKEADLFKVLAVDTRIKIIELLKDRGPLGANEMSDILGITPSAVSQHLKILRHAGLVRNERKGYWIPYEVDPEALEKCGEILTGVCTCGCKAPGPSRPVQLESGGDKMASLRKYERELEEELARVRAWMEESKTEQ